MGAIVIRTRYDEGTETTEVVTSESSAEVKNGETQTKQRVEKL